MYGLIIMLPSQVKQDAVYSHRTYDCSLFLLTNGKVASYRHKGCRSERSDGWHNMLSSTTSCLSIGLA